MRMIDSERFPATGLPDVDWCQTLWPDPEGVLRHLGIEFGVSTLDLCCGAGLFTASIAQIVGGLGRVVAVDRDSDLLERAKTRTAKAGIPAGTVRWVVCGAESIFETLPIQPDYVLMTNAFHGIEHQQQLARDVFNVLKPGGQFTVVDWHHRPRDETTVMGEPRGPDTALRMGPEQVMDQVLPVGFKLHGVVELPPYHYGIVFDKPKVC